MGRLVSHNLEISMQFDVWTSGLPAQSVDCIVTGIFEDGELGEEASAVDSATHALAC